MYMCKLCNNNLYKKISFQNIFALRYTIHPECEAKLVFNQAEIIIPIDSNIIIFDYLLMENPVGLNEAFIEMFYEGRLLEKHLINKIWSIVIMMDKKVDYFISNYNPFLLLSLTNNPILFLSLTESEISVLEENFN